jgi:hypothetical protein
MILIVVDTAPINYLIQIGHIVVKRSKESGAWSGQYTADSHRLDY